METGVKFKVSRMWITFSQTSLRLPQNPGFDIDMLSSATVTKLAVLDTRQLPQPTSISNFQGANVQGANIVFNITTGK